MISKAGGRKILLFFVCFFISCLLLVKGSWTKEFGDFTIYLIGITVAGNVVSKFKKGSGE